MINKIKPWLDISIGTLGITNTLYTLYNYYTTNYISNTYIYCFSVWTILIFIKIFLSALLSLLKINVTEDKIESKIINITSESTLGELLESKSTLETTIATIEHLIKLKNNDNS